MKRSVVFLMLALVLAGCGKDGVSPVQTTAPTEAMTDAVDLDAALRHDFSRFVGENFGFTPSLDEVRVDHLVGTYSGCPVVFMDAGLDYTSALRPVEVAGYTIVFGDGQRLYVYHDSSFYILEEAYAAGLLTAEDILAIGKKVGGEFDRYNTRHPQDDVAVDTYLAYELREDFAAQFGYAFEEVFVQRLFSGVYSDCSLVYMGAPVDHTEAERNVKLAGCTIHLPDGKPLYV